MFTITLPGQGGNPLFPSSISSFSTVETSAATVRVKLTEDHRRPGTCIFMTFIQGNVRFLLKLWIFFIPISILTNICGGGLLTKIR